MYDENHFLGPLTFRQTLIAAVGIGASVGVYYFVPDYLWLIAGIAPLTVVLVWRYRAHYVEDPRDYFLNHPNGKKRLARMIAEVESKRVERKTAGKKPDPILDVTLDKLREIQTELQHMGRADGA